MLILELVNCGHRSSKTAANTGYSKNTVNKYLRRREYQNTQTRANCPSNLSSLLIRYWMDKGITNCELLDMIYLLYN